ALHRPRRRTCSSAATGTWPRCGTRSLQSAGAARRSSWSCTARPELGSLPWPGGSSGTLRRTVRSSWPVSVTSRARSRTRRWTASLGPCAGTCGSCRERKSTPSCRFTSGSWRVCSQCSAGSRPLPRRPRPGPTTRTRAAGGPWRPAPGTPTQWPRPRRAPPSWPARAAAGLGAAGGRRQAPPVLFLAGYRRGDDLGSPFIRALREIGGERRELPVDPLSADEARDLAAALLAGAHADQAGTIARESDGSPLLVHELGQFFRPRAAADTLALETGPRTPARPLPGEPR